MGTVRDRSSLYTFAMLSSPWGVIRVIGCSLSVSSLVLQPHEARVNSEPSIDAIFEVDEKRSMFKRHHPVELNADVETGLASYAPEYLWTLRFGSSHGP